MHGAVSSRCMLARQDMANTDKERVAKLKAELPPVPKPAKGAAKGSKAATAKDTSAAKVPRAKTAYLVGCLYLPVLLRCEILSHLPGKFLLFPLFQLPDN